MVKINPELPTVGGDENTWGDENNAVHLAHIAQSNDHDDRIVVLESTQTSIGLRLSTLETNGGRPGGAAGGALSGSYPNPGLNETAVDTAVGAKIASPGTATRVAVDARIAAKAATDAVTYLSMRATPPSATERAAGVLSYVDTTTAPPTLRGWDPSTSTWVALGGASSTPDNAFVTDTGDFLVTDTGDYLIAA